MNTCVLVIIGYLGFTVGPARVEKTVLAAESFTDVFEVQNFTADSLRIKVEFEDFDIDEAGDVAFYAAGHLANSLAPIAAVNPEEFVIGPESIERLRVTFDLPRDAGVSEYYSMLVFKSQPIPTRYSAAISVAGEIGVPIYYSISKYAVREVSFDSLTERNDSLEMVLTNTGNVHARIRGEVVVTNSDMTTVQQDSLPEFVVMPGKSRRLKVAIDDAIGTGVHVARVLLDHGAAELLAGERKLYR